jgi:hypothetical protein
MLAAFLLLNGLFVRAQAAVTPSPNDQPGQMAWSWSPGQWVVVNGAYEWRAGHWVNASLPAATEASSPYVWIPAHWEQLASGGWVGIDGHYALSAPPGAGQPGSSGRESVPSHLPYQDQGAIPTAGASQAPMSFQTATDTTVVTNSSLGSTVYIDSGSGSYGDNGYAWGSCDGYAGYGGYGYGCYESIGYGGCSRVIACRPWGPCAGPGTWRGGGGWAGSTSTYPCTAAGSGGWGTTAPSPFGLNPWRQGGADLGMPRLPASPAGSIAPAYGRSMSSPSRSPISFGASSGYGRMSSSSTMGSHGMSAGGGASFGGGHR